MELVEDFWMNGVSSFDPRLVVGISAFGWKLLMLRPVEVRECPRHHIAVLELCGIGYWLEELSPHDPVQTYRRSVKRSST